VSSGTRRVRLFPEPVAAKVPEIIFLFWVAKLLTTCGGEAVPDYLALGDRLAGAVVEGGLLVIALVWQFRTRRYVAAAYWSLAYAIASLADYLGRPPSLSGVGFGSGRVAVIVTIAVAILVGYLAVTRRDIQPPPARPARPGRDQEMAPGPTWALGKTGCGRHGY